MSHQQDHNSHGRVLPSSQALSTHHSRDRQSPSSLDGLYRTKPDDELVRRLRCRARNSSEIRAFLRNYSQCKNRSSNRLFESMLSYSLFESPRLFWPLSLITPTTSGTEGPEAQTFSSDLETLRPALRMGNRESVRFCVLCFDSSDVVQSRFFPLRTKIFAPKSHLKRKYQAPRSALLHVIDQEWQLPQDVFRRLSIISERKDIRPFPYQRPKSLPNEPFVFKPLGTMYMEFEWLGSKPQYGGTTSTYIWEPHTKPPSSTKAQLFIKGIDEQGPPNVLIVLSSWDLSNGSLVEYEKDRVYRRSLPSLASSNATTEIHLSIYALYRQIMKDTAIFLESAYEQVDKLRYKGRHKPSNGKLHFLLHLDDCCYLASSGLTKALLLLDEIYSSSACNRLEIDMALKEWPQKARGAIEILQNDVKDLKREILFLREMIKEQLDLRNGFRTKLLGLLAAVYIPFAFISSLFSMHISEPIWGPVILDAMTSSNSANSEANMSSPAGFSSAETDAIVAAISSSGSYLWSFKMYWIVAAPITLATILLPLVAGPIFRRSVIYLYQNRYYARPILALLGLGGIVAMDQFAPVIPYLYVFGISYGLVALYKLIHASVYGKNQWIWTGFSIVFATSLAMYELVAAFAKVGMTGYLPLIYLFLVWYRFEIRDWIGPRLQRPWSHISKRCRMLQLLQFLQSKRWIWQVSLLCIYYTSAVLIYVNVPYYGALSIFSIPLGILAINRFIRSFVTRVYLIRWTVYTVLYTASLIMDARAAWNSDCEYDHVLYNSGPSGELGSDCGQGLLVFGFTCFVPATYLFGFWIFLDYKNPIYGFVGYWYRRGRQISLQDFYRLWPQYRRKSKLQGDPRFP